jgi:hypothetical protein
MKDMPGPPAHDRDDARHPFPQIRPRVERRGDVRQGPERHHGERAFLECVRYRPLRLRSAVDPQRGRQPACKLARRALDRLERRVSGHGRNPNDLEVARLGEQRERQAIVGVGARAVAARGIGVDPQSLREIGSWSSRQIR